MNALTKQENNYNDKVSKTVDSILRKIFGDEATHLIYTHLENRYSLKQNEIGEKIDVFAEGLEEFLRSGAYVIEMKILEDIYSSYGLTHELEFERRNKPDFVSQMKMLRAT
ncbi:MAG: hypothetical protein ACE5OV_02025 [Candidatus Bathyarchaeia archaeon]